MATPLLTTKLYIPPIRPDEALEVLEPLLQMSESAGWHEPEN